jgi:hypothetical protein
MKTTTEKVCASIVVLAIGAIVTTAVCCSGGANRAQAAEPGASAAEALKKKMALTFERNSFEDTMGIVSDEIGVPIEFMGGDLQADGITRHKGLTLDEPEQPAGELIRKILKKADPDGRLVYLIKTKSGTETLVITTRAAAEARGDKLPAEFVQPKTSAKTPAKTPAKPAKPKKK